VSGLTRTKTQPGPQLSGIVAAAWRCPAVGEKVEATVTCGRPFAAPCIYGQACIRYPTFSPTRTNGIVRRDDLGEEQGHRPLRVLGTDIKLALIPLTRRWGGRSTAPSASRPRRLQRAEYRSARRRGSMTARH
jgi:hypothetical protein